MRLRVVAAALFAAIVVLSLDREILRLSVPPRRPAADQLARRADPNPQLALFLAGVRAHTARGDSIVIALPPVLEPQADAYRFRASYHLAGRDVLRPRDVRRAKYVAAWRVPQEGMVVWAGHGGMLVRQH